MIDGNTGEVLDRNGNSSIATIVGRSLAMPNMRAIASFQSRSGASTNSPVCRESASAKSRSDSASVASVAAKYIPPAASASACTRKLLP
jgi:hypothetical protein